MTFKLQCPGCRSAGPTLKLERVPRRFSDRLASLIRPLHRYRCRADGCGWEGTLPDTMLAPHGNLRRTDRRFS